MKTDGGKTIIFRIFYLGRCGGGFERKVERKIEMKETQTFDDLHDAIIKKSFKWKDMHAYSFFMDNIPYSKNNKMEYAYEADLNDDGANLSNIELRFLNLKKGQKFLFVFDYGDDHHFGIRVEGFGEAHNGKKYPLILEEKGKPPKQYEEE